MIAIRRRTIARVYLWVEDHSWALAFVLAAMCIAAGSVLLFWE